MPHPPSYSWQRTEQHLNSHRKPSLLQSASPRILLPLSRRFIYLFVFISAHHLPTHAQPFPALCPPPLVNYPQLCSYCTHCHVLCHIPLVQVAVPAPSPTAPCPPAPCWPGSVRSRETEQPWLCAALLSNSWNVSVIYIVFPTPWHHSRCCEGKQLCPS